ncbi:MAG: hypothetical protein K2K91_11645, partial [Ruminococcus sp.]|nr:hypothetical protein [Ruminococcus sp.]
DYINKAKITTYEYIEQKYGFKPKITKTVVVKENEKRLTSQNNTQRIGLVCSDDERKFTVWADFDSDNHAVENIVYSDNYQEEQIWDDFCKYIKSYIPEQKDLTIKCIAPCETFHTMYYDGTNILDFIGDTLIGITAYYVNNDLSEKTDFDFFDEMLDSDIGYDVMLISCYSENDIEKIKDYNFHNRDYDAYKFAPYISEYAHFFGNNHTKTQQKYNKMNIHQSDGFMYSKLDDKSFACDEKNGDKYSITVDKTPILDSESVAVTPCWKIKGKPAKLRIYVPVDSINFDYEPTLRYYLLPPFTYSLEGKYTYPDNDKTKTEGSTILHIVYDYAVFDIELKLNDKEYYDKNNKKYPTEATTVFDIVKT